MAEGSSPTDDAPQHYATEADVAAVFTFSIALMEGYWFTVSLRRRRHIQRSGSGLISAGQRKQQSAGVGCLVALRDEICFPASVCRPRTPKFHYPNLRFGSNKALLLGIRPSPGWRDAAVVIAPRQTWRTVVGLTFTRTQSFNSLIYWFNSRPNRHFHFPFTACSSVIFQHSQGRQR